MVPDAKKSIPPDTINTDIQIQSIQTDTYRYNLFSGKDMTHTNTAEIKQKQTFENGF
jgi:hypothetical protein